MRTRRLVHSLQLALTLAALATAAHAQDGGAFDLPALRRAGGGGGGAIKPALDPAHSVHQRISPTGGSLQLTMPNGTAFILVIPANALLNAETVSLTAIKSIKGLPFTSLAAGVEIGPPGLRFGALSSLAILPPQPVPLFQETTFGYRAGGAQFFLFPAATDQRPVRLDIMHTGGYGIARGTAAQQATQLKKQPPKPEDQFAQRFWKSNWTDRQALPPTAKATDDLELAGEAKSQGFLLIEFTSNLERHLQEMATSCDGRKKWGPYAKTWAAFAATEPDAFGSEVADIQAALVKGDDLCYDDATTRCNNADPKQVVPSLGWWGQLIVDQGTGTVDPHQLESCLTFDLEFDTLVFEQNPAPEGYLISSDHKLDTHTVVHFRVSGATMPEGTGYGPNSYVSARWLGGVDPQCKPPASEKATGNRQPDNFDVQSMVLEGNFYEDSAPPPMVDLVYSPGNPLVELQETCEGKVVNTAYQGLFEPIYEILHILESPTLGTPGSPGELNVYEPVPGTWKVPMGASLWANRVYMDSFVFGNAVTRESTDLNLRHKPGG